jgi:hypothetical protein
VARYRKRPGAVELKLSDDEVARLEAALRPEAVSGSRYNEKSWRGVIAEGRVTVAEPFGGNGLSLPLAARRGNAVLRR